MIFSRKKRFYTDVFKNLARYIKIIILLDHQNTYIKHLSVDDNAAKNFNLI